MFSIEADLLDSVHAEMLTSGKDYPEILNRRLRESYQKLRGGAYLPSNP
jgi:hypothetical protein